MSEGAPRFRTGALWGVLALLLVVGSSGGAFVVYALSDLLAGGAHYLVDAAALGGGGVAAVLAFLMTAGILYRVDRLRGVPHRRIELFE